MKYILKAELKNAWGDIYAGRVIQVEDSGVAGVIMDENGKILGSCFSTTLGWLEQDLLSKVHFDKEKDTYTKNW